MTMNLYWTQEHLLSRRIQSITCPHTVSTSLILGSGHIHSPGVAVVELAVWDHPGPCRTLGVLVRVEAPHHCLGAVSLSAPFTAAWVDPQLSSTASGRSNTH